MSEEDKRVIIDSIYPGVKEFYHKHGLDYVPTAEDRAHRLFDQRLAGETETKIIMMYRVKKGSFKSAEYMFWREAINGEDRFGNTIQKRLIQGKWDKPIPEFRYDEKMQSPRCIGIRGFETVYDIPFDVKVLDKMVDEGKIDDYTGFAIDAGLHYAVTDFNDFRNLSFDDLLYYGRTGIRPEQREEAQKRKEKQRTGQE